MRQKILLAFIALLAAVCFARPDGSDYANARVRLVKKEAYQKLLNGSMYYASQADDPANSLSRKPMTFKWGETLYILVDHFPYRAAGTTHPPMVSVTLSAGGKALRNLFTEARPYLAQTHDSPALKGSEANSGFAVIPLTLASGGSNKPPKGGVEIEMSFISTEESGKPVTYRSSQRIKITLKGGKG